MVRWLNVLQGVFWGSYQFSLCNQPRNSKWMIQALQLTKTHCSKLLIDTLTLLLLSCIIALFVWPIEFSHGSASVVVLLKQEGLDKSSLLLCSICRLADYSFKELSVDWCRLNTLRPSLPTSTNMIVSISTWPLQWDWFVFISQTSILGLCEYESIY